MAFFGAALVAMASTSRYIFAMSRDGRFPAHEVMKRVNQRTQTPIPATMLVLAVGVILMAVMPGDALNQLIATGAIIGITLYTMTVVLYLSARKKFLDEKRGGFDLGRFDRPVAIAALVWVVFSLGVILSASTTSATLMLVAGQFLAGLAYFLYMWKFNREVLENEPGDAAILG